MCTLQLRLKRKKNQKLELIIFHQELLVIIEHLIYKIERIWKFEMY